jgi:RNA polymerase sigma-70 factor (ECF subfamily)
LVAAFESADISALARMLREDVELEMPPVPMWFAGRVSVLTFFERFVFPVSRRYLVTASNGDPAIAAYRIEADGRFHAQHVLCVELRDSQVRWMYAFLGAAQFELFNLPLTI